MKKRLVDNSLFGRVKNSLLEEIRRMKIGSRLLPERQLAEQYGVCKVTMNRALKELVTEGYLSRQVGRGTFVLPRPQPVAQVALNGTSRGEVIIVYPDFYSHGVLERVRHAEQEAMRANLRLINVKIHPQVNWGPLYELIEACRNLRGILVIAAIPMENELRRLNEVGCPIAILGEMRDAGAYERLYVIGNNHFQSGYLKMEALLAKGHRKLGWVPNEPRSIAGAEALRGMKAALYHYKLRYQDLVRPETGIRYWESSMQSGYLQTLELMNAHPELTALVIDTIPGALGALRALYELGLRCPDDVSLVTAYDFFGCEAYTCPRLTRVVDSCEDAIKIAMRIVEDGGAEAREITTAATLSEGESIRCLG